MSEAEEAAVEAWLDSHPDFFEDYFHRRGSRGLVDGWLRRRLAATSSAALGTVQLAPRSLSCSVGSGRLLGQRSHRIRKASSELHADEGSIGRTSPAMPRRHALPALTEEAATAREMMLSSLLMELDSGRLRRRIVRACRLLLAADRCALFLAEPGGWLRLTADTVAAEAAPTEPEVRVPPGVGIVGNAAATGQTLRLEEAAKDPRFNAAVDELPSCATVRALAAPLKHPDGGSIGLLLATSGGRSAAFTDAHEKSLQTFLALCSASLRNSELFQQSQLETKRNEVLLDLVRITFEHMENLELLVNNILQYMRLITRCTWCQILLIDDPSSAEGSFDRVFELLADEADGTDKSAGGGRLLISSEIAQSVLSSGEPLIVPRAESDSRLTPAERSRIRSLLCLPVRNALSEPSGLCLLMNPADGRAFSESDANLAEAFALFCGLGIHSVRQRELAETAQKRQRVALEVLGYHAAAGQEEAQRLARSLVPSARYFGIDQLAFDEFSVPEGDTLLCSIKLFQEAGLLAALQLDYRALCLWLLSVHKNYRPLLHHNWRHAFGVAHCACRLAKQSPELSSHLSPLEQLAVLVAALCHDLDHQDPDGFGQRAGLDPLAELYSSSVTERRHFSRCIMLLSLEGCDILARLPQAQYSACISLVERCILATDLRQHFESRPGLQRQAQTGRVDWSSKPQRDLLLGLVMTCSDLGTFAKPWPQHRRVAQLVTDQYRQLSGRAKVESSENAKDQSHDLSLLAEQHVAFIKSVCLPAFEMLTSLCDNLEELRSGCQANLAEWAALAAGNEQPQVDSK
ncbi:hypothetical protein BOX15_Mlig007514g2 [Macrostomum lignano]|uniref:PDEase domain-containing protein n=1 Tax=Macrostomum lignano TaxID=282301 RepID=A0A267FLC7_9PLAT|nr:hypothetical protein BOX15_Mlig007514g2 [Macrostomum lignano]